MPASQCVTISQSVVNRFLRGLTAVPAVLERRGRKGAGMTNHLYYGDNLGALRESIPDESVDLIYLDPPFNSNDSHGTHNMHRTLPNICSGTTS